MKDLIITLLLMATTLGLSARDEDTLSAEFHDDHIDMSDGRELQFSKMTLPQPGSQLVMMAPSKARVSIRYPDGSVLNLGQVPFTYKVPEEYVRSDFQLIVDEGGPLKTWTLEFNHESGYSMEITSDE